MTYEPLHHKYRPQRFSELVGQAAIAQTLCNALQQEKIAPAYLFTGARGTGKTSSARIFAKSLNCLQASKPTPEPCGVCDVCQSIANGSALDVIEIDAASNTGVDNIRDLIEKAQFAPVQCRYKLYIIDEVHMLSKAAFNALLKTLEEPPDRVVFVLATTDPQQVLPTIISRCQRFDFRRIPLEDMVQHLQWIAEQEEIAITPEALTLVGQLAQGGLRDAQSLLDQLSLLSEEIDPEQVWNLVGSVPERDLLALLEAIGQNNPEALLDSTRQLLDRGREPLTVLQNFASFYRDLLIAKTAPTRSDLVALTSPTWTVLVQLAQSMPVNDILAGQQHLRSAEVQVKNTTQPRLWLEVTLMGLLPGAIAPSANPIVPLGEPVKPASKPVVAEPNPVAPSKPTVKPELGMSIASPALMAAPPSVSAPVDTTQLAVPSEMSDPNQVWPQVLQQLQPSTRALLSQQGCLLNLTSKEAIVGLTEQWHKNIKSKLVNLEAGFEAVLGYKVQVRLEAVSSTKPKSEAASPPANLVPANPATLEYTSEPSTSPQRKLADSPVSEAPFTPDWASQVSESPESWQEDEVTRSARQLADFFNGKVVDLDEAVPASAEATPTQTTVQETSLISDSWQPSEDSENIDEDDDDVPF